MAIGDIIGNLKQRARSLYNGFFYDGAEAPAPRGMQEEYPPQQPQDYQQAPHQEPYGQPQAQGWAYAAPEQPQARNRRSVHHAAQMENKVVDFGAYQQSYQQQAPYQQPGNGYQQPGNGYQQPQPVQQPYPQQGGYQPQPAAPQMEMPQQPSANPAGYNARIINARGMNDCRSAITLLRNGDAVLIVLENVTDPAEMRRLVDTLSGACYSLTATITKVSRYGVYLLAPQSMAVYADQTTNQMNNPARPQNRGYQNAYAGRPAYPPQQAPVNAYQPQQGFVQRAAAPEEAQQPFYARTAPQAAQVPSFSAQPAGYGYAPDVVEAVAADQ